MLEATGYLPQGEAVSGTVIGDAIRRRGREFIPDAMWRSSSALKVYFKFAERRPADDLIATWRREVWNEGFAPLLWIVSPDTIELYNGFGTPRSAAAVDTAEHRISVFRNIDAELVRLDAFAGRLAMETGHFWLQAPIVDRKTGVDEQLLSDLASLEGDLVGAGLDRAAAQALIGRAIFVKYLIDRRILDRDLLRRVAGRDNLAPVLRDRPATERLFAWLIETFNGDMFPSSASEPPGPAHLARMADFLDGVRDGQGDLFPYQFDVIPIELISSIYEQFAQDRDPGDAAARSVHHTRLPLVGLVLDEIMDGCTGDETVLDLACGSAVFLVEALRRLVERKPADAPRRREVIRRALYEQIYGVDISEAAIRVAAFSLYLAALELDLDPRPPEALRFRPLIGQTLLVGDARTIEINERRRSGGIAAKTFDVIVGNPPWSFRGRAGTRERRQQALTGQGAMQPRGEALDFVRRALAFAHEHTRFGFVLSALPFFSVKGSTAAREIIDRLAPVTLVNLANMRDWLFAAPTMPAVVLFGRHRPQARDQVTVVQVPWSPAAAKTHSFEISPRDIKRLSADDLVPGRLKAAAIGHRRDLALLDALTSVHPALEARLAAIDAKLRVGLIVGDQSKDANFLSGLEFLQRRDVQPLSIPERLHDVAPQRAERPRLRSFYRAPLLLIQEFLAANARPVAAVADRDLVYSNAYYGVALPKTQDSAARALAVILSSALASWFFVMTAAEFGLGKRRLLRRDVERLPVPELAEIAQSPPGRRLLEIESVHRESDAADFDWAALDEAVFDLYRLDDQDRLVVRDGLFRASWEWTPGRFASAQPVKTAMLADYARAFLLVLDAWLSARGRRRMRAEVFQSRDHDPLRVIRFVLEEKPGPSIVQFLRPEGELGDLLGNIGRRLNVRIAHSLVGARELRVHGRDEVVIIKPAARRYWLAVAALDDADAVIAESMTGVAAA